MIYELYLLIEKKDSIYLIPGQVDTTTDIKLACHTGFKLPSSGVVLAKVNMVTFEILEIIETHPPDYWVSDELINRVRVKMQVKENEASNTTMDIPIPEDLFIDEMVWKFSLSALEIGTYPFYIGPKGCGKTQTAISLAAATDRQFFSINAGAIFKPKQTLVGSMQVTEGNTFLVHSEFLTYYTSDKPTLILIDELSRIMAGASNYFITILDRLQSYVYVEEMGKKLFKGKDVIFVATGNFGFEYTDTRNLDGSLLDRFTKFPVNYLPPEKEIPLICQRVPGSNIVDIERLVENANICRRNIDKLRVSVSTRQLLDMAAFLKKGFKLKEVEEYVFQNIFINGSFDERDTFKQLISGG